MFLTDSEIKELTHKQRRPAQVRMLRAMGVEHRQRPDGSIAVLKKHVEYLFGGKSAVDDHEESELNWDHATLPTQVRK